jgi:hypothetical protein
MAFITLLILTAEYAEKKGKIHPQKDKRVCSLLTRRTKITFAAKFFLLLLMYCCSNAFALTEEIFSLRALRSQRLKILFAVLSVVKKQSYSTVTLFARFLG